MDGDVDVWTVVWMCGWWCGCMEGDLDVWMVVSICGRWRGCVYGKQLRTGIMMWMRMWEHGKISGMVWAVVWQQDEHGGNDVEVDVRTG